MTAAPEIVDLAADPDLDWVLRVFGKAKETLEECARDHTDFMPVCFMVGADQKMHIVGFHLLGEGLTDAAARKLREMAKEARATDIMVIVDVNQMYCSDPVATAALTLDNRLWRSWSPEQKQRVGFRRREALFAHIELHGGLRAMGLSQFYRRESGLVVFEECVRPIGAVGGFTRLLPPVAMTDEIAEFLEKLMRLGTAEGYSAHVGAEWIELVRPDGTTHMKLERAGNEENFERVAEVLRKVQGS